MSKVIKYIGEILEGIKGSFDNTQNGYSARKISAFVVILLVVSLHIKWFKSEQWQYIAEILFLDYTFVLVCLGLATWQNVQNKKLDIQANEK